MRIASFNVENMFRRPRAMNQATWADGRQVLERFAELQNLFEKSEYTDSDRAQMASLLNALGLDKSDESQWVFLRRTRGSLLKRGAAGITVVGSGRADWIGWLELKVEAVDETATRNTARVIADVNADLLVVIEAESRPALARFNDDVLKKLPKNHYGPNGRWSYAHAMLIDGNDDRGIDVGLYAKAGFDIASMRSHVDDLRTKTSRVFSRDCPEFWIDTPGGNKIVVLANHFKSKGYGDPAESDATRKAQAKRVAEIYLAAKSVTPYVVIAGDLNDTPDSKPLAPLLKATDLQDASASPNVPADGWSGTYGPTGREKIDYLLCSPEVFDLIGTGGVHRAGVWHAPKAKKPWPLYDTLTKPTEAASDHAALWIDIDLP